jgi:hypothetical protein
MEGPIFDRRLRSFDCAVRFIMTNTLWAVGASVAGLVTSACTSVGGGGGDAGLPGAPSGVAAAVGADVHPVTTLAGSGAKAFADGTGVEASFLAPSGVAVDAVGFVYVADYGNLRIRKVSPTGVVTTLAGSGLRSYTDGVGAAASFGGPACVAVDTAGNVYVSDASDNRIRKVTAAGAVTTLTGSGIGGFIDPKNTSDPRGVAVDAAGNLYVADWAGVLRVTPAGVVATLAGRGVGTWADGTTVGSFFSPLGIALDAAGNVYTSDRGYEMGNYQGLFQVTSEGVVTKLAGSPLPGSADGLGAAASFKFPEGIATDPTGNTFVADVGNHRIRKVTPTRAVTTYAGSTEGFADGIAALFKDPSGVAVDTAGNVYVADTGNHRIRKISSIGVPSVGQLAVTWRPPTIPGSSAIVGYTAVATASGHTTQNCSTTSTLCTISGLASNVPYAVTVTASNAAGTSPPSAPATATPN